VTPTTLAEVTPPPTMNSPTPSTTTTTLLPIATTPTTTVTEEKPIMSVATNTSPTSSLAPSTTIANSITTTAEFPSIADDMSSSIMPSYLRYNNNQQDQEHGLTESESMTISDIIRNIMALHFQQPILHHNDDDDEDLVLSTKQITTEEASDDISKTTTFSCFSGKVTLQKKNGEHLRMKDLQIGDEILTSYGIYEPIYSFGHYDMDTPNVAYLQFFPSKLEISPEHMLFINENKVVAASQVRIGDSFVNDNNDAVVVTDIRTVLRRGRYAPFTPSGTIVINGVMVSNYISLFNTAEDYYFSPHWLSHTLVFPRRFWCYYLSNKSTRYCHNESYSSDNGIAVWTQIPMNILLSHYLFEEEQNNNNNENTTTVIIIMRIVIITFLLLLSILFASLEFLILLSLNTTITTAILIGSIVVIAISSLTIPLSSSGKGIASSTQTMKVKQQQYK